MIVNITQSIESVGVLGGYLIGGEERVVLYTGGEGGRVRLWDIKTHECVYTQPTGEQQVSLVDVQHCASQASLVCATSDQNIQFLSLADNLKRSKQIIGYNDEVIDLLFVSSYLLAITNSNQLRLFDCNSADSCLLANAHKDIILCADKHQESLTVLTGSKDNTAKLWRVNSDASDDILECVGELVGHTESITAVALAKKRLAFCLTASQDCTVKKWQLSDSLKCLYTVKAHDKDINSLDIAPNDRMFATGSQDRTVKMWSVETGELLGTLKGHKRGVWCVRFSPVEQLIASSSGDKTIKLWSTQDMTCLKVSVLL